MGAARIDMHRLQEVIRLHRLGRSGRAIARQLRIGRNTMGAYLDAVSEAGLLEGWCASKPGTGPVPGDASGLLSSWKSNALQLYTEHNLAQRFQDAWNRSGVEAVGGFFRSPDGAAEKLERLAERRGWQRLPRVDSFRETRRSENAVGLEYGTDLGVLDVERRFRGDRWALLSIKPPPSDG